MPHLKNNKDIRLKIHINMRVSRQVYDLYGDGTIV